MCPDQTHKKWSTFLYSVPMTYSAKQVLCTPSLGLQFVNAFRYNLWLKFVIWIFHRQTNCITSVQTWEKPSADTFLCNSNFCKLKVSVIMYTWMNNLCNISTISLIFELKEAYKRTIQSASIKYTDTPFLVFPSVWLIVLHKRVIVSHRPLLKCFDWIKNVNEITIGQFLFEHTAYATH